MKEKKKKNKQHSNSNKKNMKSQKTNAKNANNKLIEKDKMAYINSINVVEQTKKNLLANANYNMCIDNLLLKLWEEFNEQNKF